MSLPRVYAALKAITTAFTSHGWRRCRPRHHISRSARANQRVARRARAAAPLRSSADLRRGAWTSQLFVAVPFVPI